MLLAISLKMSGVIVIVLVLVIVIVIVEAGVKFRLKVK